MPPEQLKQLNIDRFHLLLRSETDPKKRALLERLLAEEMAKDASEYPVDDAARGNDRPSS